MPPTLLWLGSMLLLPLGLLVAVALKLSGEQIWQIMSSERVVASLWLSFKMAGVATLINLIFGFLLAWVLVRYEFVGKKWINALIDLPFALPTAVAGIALATLYSPNGLLGTALLKLNIQLAYTPAGIAIALIFVSLPFVVRAIQPVLATANPALEEAASILGANGWQTFFRVILPPLYPALIAGAGMGFARSLGEYGSVIFIAGNVPLVSEIAPLIIMSKLDLYDVSGASVVALLMLSLSLLLLLLINLWQWRLVKRVG